MDVYATFVRLAGLQTSLEMFELMEREPEITSNFTEHEC
jgi:hypothetical protein